jgi:diguanylate cyclase (GGDEF)-like protein
VLFDLDLPGESGLSVLHHLRGDEREVPVLLVEGADPLKSAIAFEAGADDLLPATVAPVELISRLRRRLSLARRLDALVKERDELKALSTTDGLTQLANHRAFQERLREEFRRAQRYDDPMAVILMDIDHFKDVNDTHGHLAGDEVLRMVAATLRSAVRETDFIARYGGEEFGVLLPKTHLAGALTVAERMSQSLRTGRAGVDGAIRVTGSFGVSGFPGRGVTTAEQLLKTADDALYRSKREGRNKISLFQAALFVARNG